MQVSKNLPFLSHLRFALAGVAHGLRSEYSLRAQSLALLAVLITLAVLRPAPLWWAVVLLASSAVLAAELFNTAIERLADHLHPEVHPEIHVVKDCAAAGVLICSVGALVRVDRSRCTAVSRILLIVLTVRSANFPVGKTAGRSANTGRPPAPQPQFNPSMGDLMTMLVQPRHIKLGLAGHAGNWNYAAYEVGEIRGAFRRVGQTMPIYNKQDFVALIATMTTAPIAAVQAAIKQRDRAAFRSAYAQLTAACNACHVSQHHAPIVIKIPLSSPYVDQEFRPPSGSP